MKAILVVLTILVLAFSALVVNPAQASFGGPKVGDVVADGGPDGDKLVIGYLQVLTFYRNYLGAEREFRDLEVSISLEGGWKLTTDQIEVRNDANFPVNHNGNPKPGQFQINDKNEDTTGISWDYFRVDGDIDAAQTIYIAIHLEVYNPSIVDEYGNPRTEGAWVVGNSGYGSTTVPFSGPSWATYLTFVSPAGTATLPN